MLIDSISSPWVRFKVLFGGLHREEEKGCMAKEAFLHVIATYNAFSCQKLKTLDDIVAKCSNVVEDVSSEEMFANFQYFCNEMSRRNQIVSPAELGWINKYIKNAEIRTGAESLIYLKLLEASSYWDKMRKEFCWAISEDDKRALARSVLQFENLGSKRQMELAKEFGEPEDQFVNAYYRKLLWDRHYDKAESLGVHDPSIVIDVIILNINNGHYQDALRLAQRFLQDRNDIILEIQQVIAAFRD